MTRKIYAARTSESTIITLPHRESSDGAQSTYSLSVRAASQQHRTENVGCITACRHTIEYRHELAACYRHLMLAAANDDGGRHIITGVVISLAARRFIITLREIAIRR